MQSVFSIFYKLMYEFAVNRQSKYSFISMVLLRIPTAVQPMTGIERFKYQASDG